MQHVLAVQRPKCTLGTKAAAILIVVGNQSKPPPKEPRGNRVMCIQFVLISSALGVPSRVCLPSLLGERVLPVAGTTASGR